MVMLLMQLFKLWVVLFTLTSEGGGAALSGIRCDSNPLKYLNTGKEADGSQEDLDN